jgi:peroxidase
MATCKNTFGSCAIMALLFFSPALVSAQLSTDFYDETCPDALDIIEDAVRAAVSKESRMGASLLRLHFHDCFVNASTVCSSLHKSQVSCPISMTNH